MLKKLIENKLLKRCQQAVYKMILHENSSTFLQQQQLKLVKQSTKKYDFYNDKFQGSLKSSSRVRNLRPEGLKLISKISSAAFHGLDKRSVKIMNIFLQKAIFKKVIKRLKYFLL